MTTREGDILLTPSNPSNHSDDHTIDVPSCQDLHSCSLYTFFNQLSSNHQPYNDILHLISKYYTPTQTSTKPVQKTLQSIVRPLKVQCNSVPIPSWNLASNDMLKQYPSLCPYLSQHLTLEILFWLLLLVFFKAGVPNLGSCGVLFVFYILIQCMIWSMGCLYKEGFYRYEHIVAAPLYDKDKRISYFNQVFGKAPTVTASMDLHESDTMADMGWQTVDKALIVDECCTFIEPNIGKEDDKEYRSWLYCIEYETDIDFMDAQNRTRFEKLCVGFIKRSIQEDMVHHSFNVNVTHNLCGAYNGKYWSGYILVVNSECQMSVDLLLVMIKLFNILCLSLLYKVPLYFVTKKQLNIVKYLGFGA
eukprot:38587_1